MEKRRLGRGLEALLGEGAASGTATAEAPLHAILQNPHQPRKSFDADELASLSASIKAHGVLQPLVVRQFGEGYQLIAGERRLRAATEAGLASVPIRIVDFNDQEVLEAALAENIQRSDLNPIEKAQGFKEYLDRFGLNHDQLAQRLGLARSSITNLVNLLDLAAEVQEGLRNNQISEAHAKILKGIKDHAKQIAVFRQIVSMGLSVKATDQFLREMKDGTDTPPAAVVSERHGSGEEKTAHVRSLEDELRQRLATPVEIKLRSKEKGQIVIRFDTNDDFMRVMDALRK